MISQGILCSDIFQVTALTRAVAYRSVLSGRDVRAGSGNRDGIEVQLVASAPQASATVFVRVRTTLFV
jgi:hypothetical protein